MATITPDSLLADVMKNKRSGKKRKGVSTGFSSIDEYMRLVKKSLTLITGFPSYGKSTLLDALAINTSLLHDWKWLYYSTENDDYSSHLSKLIAYKMGKSTYYATETEITEAVTWANEHFAWIDSGDAFYTMDNVMEQCAIRIESGEEVDVLVIDPWNELNHQAQAKRDDQYISDCMARLTKFSKKYDIVPIVVIHPNSIEKNKDGSYPIPHLRNCNGGQMWWNKAHIGVCVHRKDFNVQGAHVYIQKAKTTEIGYQGAVFLDYELGSGRFKDQGASEFTIPEPPDNIPCPF